MVASSQTDGRRGIERAFDEVARLTGVLSTYDPSTPLARLNQDGAIDAAPDEVLVVLARAQQISELSEGAFDITVQPVLKVFDRTFGSFGRAPTSDEVDAALALVAHDRVSIVGRRVTLEVDGMRISVDAIAKGFIIDRATEVLVAAGIEHALVDIGGDLRAVGHPPDRSSWTVALRHPREPGGLLTRIALSGHAVATSGDYEHYFVDDRSAHHLIDPRTGRSASELASVTIVADTAIDADALATATFVMGPVDGMTLVNSLPRVEALMVSADGTVRRSSGFDALECPE